jgi:signal peptidase II
MSLSESLRRSAWPWLAVSALVIVADQLSKLAIERRFELFDFVPVLPVLDITRLHNTGAAFSFLASASGWQRWFFIVLSLSVAVALLIWIFRSPRKGQSLLVAGLSLVLGGALGNVIDRIRLGHVIDFIHVHWQQAYFPAFNVADSAITVGAACLLLDALFETRRKRVELPSSS